MNYDIIMILSYGITFGIVFMTIIYTFIRYISSKEIIYISYSFMQLFSLGFIILYSEMFYLSKTIQDVFLILATLSAVIFALSFYKGKFLPSITNTKELLINTLLLNIVILTAFYHYILFEYLPYTVIYALLFISIIFNIKESYKPTLIYVIGWSVFCLVLFIVDFKQIYISRGFIDIVLVAFAIEAVLFTISISYTYTNLKREKAEYEDMLLTQSRLAKSGEMINNITHQFRQPLNNISYMVANLKKRYQNDKLTSEYFYKKTDQMDEQLQFLSTTIDQFKEFYTPTKQKESFLLKEVLENSLTVLSSELKKRDIELTSEFKISKEVKIEGIKNELSQVLVSILVNASDALKDIEFPKITIVIDGNDAEVIIDIINNGKPINQLHIEKIFDPYFSTKEDGTGIGLYLCKLIMERSFHGNIKAVNIDEGVKFTLTIEKTI